MVDGRYLLVITADAEAAPTALFFSRLAASQPDTVRIVKYRRDRAAALLGHAAAVVFVRGLFEFGPGPMRGLARHSALLLRGRSFDSSGGRSRRAAGGLSV